jgi:hypothetical protein
MKFWLLRVENQGQIVQFEGWMNCWKLEKIDLGITPSFAKYFTLGFPSITPYRRIALRKPQIQREKKRRKLDYINVYRKLNLTLMRLGLYRL